MRATSPVLGRRYWLTLAVAAISLIGSAAVAGAQVLDGRSESAATLGSAMDLETAGSYRQAAGAYRAVLGGVDLTSALLGLERVYAALGWTDSLLPVLDSLIDRQPTNTLLLSVRLRALIMSGQEQRANTMFEQWARRSSADPQPYRDYARLLLDAGRIMAADSVLQRAQSALGSGRDVAMELAQLRSQMGLWGLSAVSWREAMITSPYLVQATVFALLPAPAGARDSVRAAFLDGPPQASAREALARLELAWGDAGAGWRALAQHSGCGLPTPHFALAAPPLHWRSLRAARARRHQLIAGPASFSRSACAPSAFSDGPRMPSGW